MQNKPKFTTSYSGMKSYLSCPLKWAAEKYYKVLPYTETQQMKEGNIVHKALENALKLDISIEERRLLRDKNYTRFLTPIYKMQNEGYSVLIEKELGLTKSLIPCSWSDWDNIWFRNKSDVLCMKGTHCFCFDWKNGSRFSASGYDKADIFQIKVNCAVTSIYYPEIETFTGYLVFLNDANSYYSISIKRQDLLMTWGDIINITDAMESFWERGVFYPKQSGLCKNYCDYTACYFCGKKGSI